MSRIVVTGASGAQGGAIATAFQSAGHTVVGLTRAARPDLPDLTAVDLDDPDALVHVLEKADALVITSPIDHRPGTRERFATQLVEAASRAGVERIMLNTAGAIPPDLHRPVADVLRRVRDIVTGANTATAVIEPTIYMDNLLQPWAAAGLARGTLLYPAPAHASIAWISHATLAQYAVAALDHARPGGTILEIGGPEALTGDQAVAQLASVLGRPITYDAMPLDVFAAGLNAAMGAGVGDDIADYYRHLHDNSQALARGAEAAAKLGVQPESLAEWAARNLRGEG